MFLKRSIVLAAGVLLFIAAFIIYFDVSHAQMEDRFRAEREKFHVQGVILTAAGPAATATAPSAATAPVSTPNTNTLIGPVPPPSSSPADSTTAPAAPAAPAAPDTNSAPAPSAVPAAPDTNAAPVTPPSSTMDYPQKAGRSPFLVLASYTPGDGASVQYSTANPPAPATSATSVAPSPSAQTPTATATPVPVNPPSTNGGNVEIYPSTTPKTAPVASAAGNTRAPLSASGEGSVIVLLYHQFRPPGVKIPAMYQWTMNSDIFESEMKYIHDNGYHVVPLSDVLRFVKHEITLPPGSVAITIDDGYKSAIVYAAPILKKYGYPWTFFIYPDFITVNEGSGAASWKDLLELQAEGVDIESHSMTHPNLKLHHQKIKGAWHNFTPEEYAAWLTNETTGSKAILEQKMGKTITCFAYPYGEYNKQVEAAAIAAGYEAIFTVADNPVHGTTNLHSIGRYTITQGVEKNFAAYLRQGALGLGAADPAPGATVTNPRPVITATLGYAGTLDPKSIETSVRDFGTVRHDFDPQTNTVRLYLPHDLIQPVVLVNIRVEDAATRQVMVANWHFNYEPGGAAATAIHPAIAPATNASSPSASAKTPTAASPTTASVSTTTNAPAATYPPTLPKSAEGIPLDPPQSSQASPQQNTNTLQK